MPHWHAPASRSDAATHVASGVAPVRYDCLMPLVRTRQRETHVAVLLVMLAVLMFASALTGVGLVLQSQAPIPKIAVFLASDGWPDPPLGVVVAIGLVLPVAMAALQGVRRSYSVSILVGVCLALAIAAAFGLWRIIGLLVGQAGPLTWPHAIFVVALVVLGLLAACNGVAVALTGRRSWSLPTAFAWSLCMVGLLLGQ